MLLKDRTLPWWSLSLNRKWRHTTIHWTLHHRHHLFMTSNRCTKTLAPHRKSSKASLTVQWMIISIIIRSWYRRSERKDKYVLWKSAKYLKQKLHKAFVSHRAWCSKEKPWGVPKKSHGVSSKLLWAAIHTGRTRLVRLEPGAPRTRRGVSSKRLWAAIDIGRTRLTKVGSSSETRWLLRTGCYLWATAGALGLNGLN